MRQHLILIAVLLALDSKALVKGVELGSDCTFSGYLGGKIYCYIGLTAEALNNSIYSLDIDQYYGQPVDSMRDKWVPVKPRIPFDTEYRRNPIGIVLPDGKRFLLAGGYGIILINQTVVYDVTTNSWQSALNYTEIDRGVRQISMGSAVNLPNGLVGFYGGYEHFADNSVPRLTTSGANVSYQRNVGFTSIQMYSPEAKTWAPFHPQFNPPPNFYPKRQTATLNRETGKVYYLGGRYDLVDTFGNSTESLVGFSWAYTFDTNSGSWLNETFGGEIPSARMYHTADLLPNSPDIIIYGGTDDDHNIVPSAESCFTLNLKNNTWTKQNNVHIPSNLSGPRFDHFSILVNTTLFILFGRGEDPFQELPFLLLDVADVANISYTPIFNKPSAIALPRTTNITNTQNLSSSSLSKGTIGGIAAGVAIAVLLLFAFILYLICSRRRSKQKKAQNNEHDQMHVDWDKIDEQYRETTPAGHSANSPQSANSTGATTKASFSPDTTSTLRSPYTPNPANLNVIDKSRQQQDQFTTQERSVIMKPSSPDYNVVKPSFEGEKNRGYTVVKPDGS